jgi:hypothetical protein
MFSKLALFSAISAFIRADRSHMDIPAAPFTT